MVFRKIVAVGCVSSLADAWPSPQDPPRFSFATIGDMSMVHALKTTEFTKKDLQLLTRHSMVQFDKMQHIDDMPGANLEDRLIAAGKAVKAHDPAVKTLFYMNGMLNFKQTRLYNATAADPETYLLQNSDGQKIVEKGRRLFDVRKPAMRQLFVEDARYGVESGAFDGVFIDRANWVLKLSTSSLHGQWDQATVNSLIPAQRTLLDELQTSLTDSHIVLAKESVVSGQQDWQVVNAAMVKDAFCSTYNPKNHPHSSYNKQTCLEQIQYVQHVSRRPMLTQMHAMGPADDVAAREFTMACFLVAAGNLSFFSYVDWDYSWTIKGVRWWPEYDRPVGEPNGPAERDGWRFTRSFASGTTVAVDLDAKTANISWASTVLV